MKKKLLSGLLLITLLLTVISANPTQSQKQRAVANVPAAKPAEDVAPPSTERITALEEKAKGIEKNLDSNLKRADRMLYQVGALQTRQGHIMSTLAEREVKVLAPISDVQIEASPERPEVKPVEPTRPSWWRRVFGHERQ